MPPRASREGTVFPPPSHSSYAGAPHDGISPILISQPQSNEQSSIKLNETFPIDNNLSNPFFYSSGKFPPPPTYSLPTQGSDVVFSHPGGNEKAKRAAATQNHKIICKNTKDNLVEAIQDYLEKIINIRPWHDVEDLAAKIIREAILLREENKSLRHDLEFLHHQNRTNGSSNFGLGMAEGFGVSEPFNLQDPHFFGPPPLAEEQTFILNDPLETQNDYTAQFLHFPPS